MSTSDAVPCSSPHAAASSAKAEIRVAVVNHVGKSFGGAERSLEAFLRSAPENIEPVVVLFEDGSLATRFRSLGIEVHVLPLPESLLRTRREAIGVDALVRVPWSVARAAILLRKLRVDVVYTNSLKAHFIGGVAGWLNGKPLVMHYRDRLVGGPRRLFRLLSRLTGSVCIACSNAVRAELGLKRMTVVYSPVAYDMHVGAMPKEESRAALGLPNEIPVIAFVGRLDRWKGVERFIRIIARVREERRVTALIVGSAMSRDTGYFSELQNLVAMQNLGESLRFLPWRENIRDVYSSADIVVNCSTREPLGRTLAEAAAAGICGVAFDDSGAAEWMLEITPDCVVSAADEAEFARAIIRLLDSGAAFERSESLKRYAERFDSRKIALEITAVLLSVRQVSKR